MLMEVEKCVPVVKASGRYCPKWMNRAAKIDSAIRGRATVIV
jgi:hypothetical protein